MELEGRVFYQSGEYWMTNQEEGWSCLLEVGSQFEVLVGSQWQAVSMQSGGSRGRYLRFTDGCWTRPAVCMRVRLDSFKNKSHKYPFRGRGGYYREKVRWCDGNNLRIRKHL